MSGLRDTRYPPRSDSDVVWPNRGSLPSSSRGGCPSLRFILVGWCEGSTEYALASGRMTLGALRTRASWMLDNRAWRAESPWLIPFAVSTVHSLRKPPSMHTRLRHAPSIPDSASCSASSSLPNRQYSAANCVHWYAVAWLSLSRSSMSVSCASLSSSRSIETTSWSL